ncbi:thermonuclease family protein [Patescibacteria group bacterium]
MKENKLSTLRLLRYVWVGDQMVNELLVREGFAMSSSYPPDIKYQEQFVEAQRNAREESKGLWGSYCDTWGKPISTPIPVILKPTNTPIPVYIPQPTSPPPTQAPSSGSYACNCSKTCPNMSSCEEAYFQLNNCGCSIRDGDDDGVPCEDICPGG